MSRNRLRIAALLATMMSFTALGLTPADEIRELRNHFNSAIARHDVEAVISFLDVEYQITTGRGDVLHGRAGEANGWRAEFARADDLVYVRTPESIDISASGERAAEIGSWVGSWTTPGGPHRAGGRYAAHWRRVDESWKIRAELFVTLWCEGVGCS